MKFQSILALGLIGSVAARTIPLARDVLTTRDVNSAQAAEDVPAVQNAIGTLTKAIKEATRSLNGITEANMGDSVGKWVNAGKIINQGFTTAAGQIQGSPPLGLFNVMNLFQPLQKFAKDVSDELSNSATVFPMAQKTVKGKEGMMHMVHELEPGLKKFTVSVFSQLPTQLTNMAGSFGVSIPKQPQELDKAFDVLNRALDLYCHGAFDRLINSLQDTNNAGTDLLKSGTLDKVLGQAPGTLQQQLQQLAVKAASGNLNPPSAAQGGFNLGSLAGLLGGSSSKGGSGGFNLGSLFGF